MPHAKEKPSCNFNSQWAFDVTEQLDTIEEKLNHILNDMHGNLPIIPELEIAVRRNAWLVRKVDLKVPDQPKNKPKGN